jgi:hypothetical protein
VAALTYRTRRILVLAAALIAAAHPEAKPLSAKGVEDAEAAKNAEASHRIAFASEPAAQTRNRNGLRILGRLDAGFWFSADTGSLLALRKRDSTVRILFHDLSEYHERVRGLAPGRIAVKVREEMERIRDNGDLRILEHCARREREALSGIAAASGGPGETGSVWRALYHEQLKVMAALETPQPSGLEPRELLSLLYGMLEELNEETELLRKMFPGRMPSPDASLESARDRLALDLRRAKALLSPGGPQPAPRGPPQGRRRGWHVTPYDSALAHPSRGEDSRPALRWKEGVVTVLDDWRVPSLEKRGFKASPLYLDEASLRRDFILFDPVQLPERFRRQREAMAGIGPVERIASLQLELLLDGGGAVRSLAATHGKLAGYLRVHLQAEEESLRSLLAAHPVWVEGERRKGAGDTEGRLRRQAGELEFALAWARLSGWNGAVALESALDGKHGMIARISR